MKVSMCVGVLTSLLFAVSQQAKGAEPKQPTPAQATAKKVASDKLGEDIVGVMLVCRQVQDWRVTLVGLAVAQTGAVVAHLATENESLQNWLPWQTWVSDAGMAIPLQRPKR